ncbi:hypothetical protein HY095_02550 [Candidatus Micrarchaeota archaeon]|nr:hypothetical protein [Candidatus Micrarchaeota archaeon]
MIRTRRIALLIALLLALAPIAHSDGGNPSSPKLVGKSTVLLNLNWTLDFGERVPSNFVLKVFGFPTTAFQSASIDGAGRSFERKTDDFGNVVLEYSFTPAGRNDVVSLRALANVDYSKREPAQGNLSAFLPHTPVTNSNDEMRRKAAELTANARDDLEKLAVLSEFVHNRVRYDGPGYGNTVNDAAWTYQNKVGTCDEYSHLLVSMLRDANISAKFVAGFVCSANCSSPGQWGPHAWVEAAVNGEWVPADPTFNEVGFLDATHVKFAEGRDQNDIKEQVSTVAFNYDIAGVKLDRQWVATLDDWSEAQRNHGLSLQVPAARVGAGSIETITAEVSNPGSAPIAVPLSLGYPGELKSTDAKDAVVYLAGGESKKREWRVAFPNDLTQGFVYNYSFALDSVGEPVRAYATASLEGESKLEPVLELQDVSTKLEEGNLVFTVRLKNSGNRDLPGAQVKIDTPILNETRAEDVPAGETVEIVFKAPLPEGIGDVEGLITVESKTQSIKQPISVNLKAGDSTPAAQDQLPAGFAITPIYLAGAAIVMVIILAAAVLLRKSNSGN